jgi:hypothetical protein
MLKHEETLIVLHNAKQTKNPGKLEMYANTPELDKSVLHEKKRAQAIIEECKLM